MRSGKSTADSKIGDVSNESSGREGAGDSPTLFARSNGSSCGKLREAALVCRVKSLLFVIVLRRCKGLRTEASLEETAMEGVRDAGVAIQDSGGEGKIVFGSMAS